jgi:hypothetical protein
MMENIWRMITVTFLLLAAIAVGPGELTRTGHF